MRLTLARLAAWFATLALAAAGVARVRRIGAEVKTPVDLPAIEYATSKTCVMCHPGHFESWHRTFHRTMTQAAGPAAVVGDFGNATFTYAGITSRFTREGDRFFIETLGPAGAMERDEVVMTIGSRRVQQYVAWKDGRHLRLPLAWNIEERRWIHLNGGFLDPDGLDFNAHRVEWDNNCIFCHNVKARPRYDAARGTYAAEVAEMGIACEACHGPAEAHVKRNADPLRRYLLYFGAHDPTIRSPRTMTPGRQAQVCGHCHGQRLPNPRRRLAQFILDGDPYTAGEDLAAFTAPIDAHTELEGADFAPRFWRDGTPRLTAYEYQGLLQSKGHENTRLTCISCHSMHRGDPRGMIRDAMRGDAGCLQCHAEIARDVAGHTHHDPSGAGSRCYACHMPRTTYGILAIHPSHRITNPEPAIAWRYDMPEACTLCHVDRTAAWAAREEARQYRKPEPTDLPGAREWETAEAIRALLAGDAVQRAVAIEALADSVAYARPAASRAWVAPFLMLAMEDGYPAARDFAWRGLRRVVAREAVAWPALAAASRLPEFDYLAEPPVRAAVIAAWRGWWRALDKRALARAGEAVPLDAGGMPDSARIAALRAAQRNQPIAIGE